MIETYSTGISNDFLYEREQIVIKEYKSNGYNLVNGCDGGQGLSPEELRKLWKDGIYKNSKNHKKIFMKEIEISKIREFSTIRECEHITGVSDTSIHHSIDSKKIIKNKFMFSFDKNINDHEYKKQKTGAIITKEKLGKKFYMVNTITKNVIFYESLTQCSNDNNLDVKNVATSIKEMTTYNDEFIFVEKFPDDIDSLIMEYKDRSRDRKMNGSRIMKENNKISIKIIYKDGSKIPFNSIKECSRIMKIKQSTIRKYRNTGLFYKNKFKIIQ